MGIKIGSFVQAGDLIGRVDLVVRNGSVPGVKTAEPVPSGASVCRLVVYSDGKATSERKAVPMDDLALVPPVGIPEGKSGVEAVLAMHRDHEQYVADAGLPASARLSSVAVKTAYDRGVKAYPGPSTGLSAEQWGLGRAAHLVKTALATEAIDTNDADLLNVANPANPATPRRIPWFPEIVPLGIAENRDGLDPEFDAEVDETGDQAIAAPGEIVDPPADEDRVEVNPEDIAAMLADLDETLGDDEG